MEENEEGEEDEGPHKNDIFNITCSQRGCNMVSSESPQHLTLHNYIILMRFKLRWCIFGVNDSINYD